MKIKIWGARGSIPSPTRPDEIREKIISALLGVSQIEPGEFKDELIAAILENPPDSSGQSINLASAKTQVKRRQVLRTYLDKLPPFSIGTASGNTPCVEVQTGDEIFIIDAGSGIRQLGLELMKGACGQGKGVVRLFFSHPHWDHIQGFPFFRPAFVPGNKIYMYSVHDLEAALRRQQEEISFPVPLDYMQAQMEFIRLDLDDVLEFGDLRIRLLRNHHPGHAYSFRFEKADKVFVYASDAAYPAGTDLRPYLNFFSEADVLIYDSQFTLQESDEKEDWGHSSALVGVEMAQEAAVKNLVLFHYDPTYTDKDLEKILEDTLKFQKSQYPTQEQVNVVVAQEGQTFDLTPPRTAQLQQVPGGKAAIVKPTGIFNERVAAEMKKELAELKENSWASQVIIDMADVEMLQVAGLRALVKLRREHPGTPMVLAGPSGNVQQVIELAGYLDFFAIYPSVHTALNALKARETLNLPGQTLKNRYQIETKISDGQLGTIFKATDTHLGRLVAVKILSASFSDGAIDRFLRHAREIIDLTHPNIVNIFECEEDRGLSFMVEEFVEGQTLQKTFQQQAGEALPLDTALSIAVKITQALEYAHAHGVIHGDLKPQNVLIANNEVKISDFGLGRLEGGRSLMTLDVSLALITPHYLAPEQVLGQAVDARTDLYALGVILYELFTGHLLFEGNDQEILEHHRLTLPKPPRQHNPKLSRSLEYLILKLLDKDPNKRYATVRHVRRILVGMAMTVSGRGQSQTVPRPNWPIFVGRAEPLQHLLALWEETRLGHGQLVFVQGELGLGKSRLIQEFADQVGLATVFIGHCQNSEGSVAYQPFIDALKTYFATTPPELASRQVGEMLSEVAHFVPEIQHILPAIDPATAPATPDPASFSLIETIKQAATDRPWLIIMDDLDWADQCSLQLLDYLARHCRETALMIVATYGQDISDNKPLTEMLSHLQGHLAYTSLALRHLLESEVKELLESIWGQSIPQAMVAAIYRRAQGNPLFVAEMAKNLVDEGVITWHQGHWHFGSVVDSNLPQRLRETILRRIRCLAKETQSVLQQAAVIGYSFSFEDLHAITDLSEQGILENLDAALEKQLIKVLADGSYCFSNLRTQQVLYENLSSLKQRLFHREIAEALEQRHLPDTERTAALLAHHYFQAKELEKGLVYSIQAGTQATALYASHNALVWYTQALDVLDQLEPTEAQRLQRFELLLAREQIYDNLGERIAQGADLAVLQSLMQTLNDPAKQALVHNRQARYERALNHFDQAISEAQAALIAARQANQPALQGEGFLHLAHISASQGHLEMARAHIYDAQEILGNAGNSQFKAKTLNGLGDMYKLLKDYAQAEIYYQQALELNRANSFRYGEAVSLSSLGSLSLKVGDPAQALAYCRQALHINRLTGHRRGEAQCLYHLSLAYKTLGQEQAAQRCMEESMAIRHSFAVASENS
jgi:anti-anti-sigma factor